MPLDSLSGHYELSHVTGCPVYFSREEELLQGTAPPKRETCVSNNAIYKISSRFVWRVLETPGHTPGALTWLLCRNKGKEAGTPLIGFTGATLLNGAVGRTDVGESLLNKPSSKKGKRSLVESLFESLQQLDTLLPASIDIYPAYGPGSPVAIPESFCLDLRTTLAEQRQQNEFFRAKNKEAFTELMDRLLKQEISVGRTRLCWDEVVRENSIKWDERKKILPAPPASIEEYHPAVLTQRFGGALPFKAFLQRLISLESKHGRDSLIIIDGRDCDKFAQCHLQGSLNVPVHTSSPVEDFWGIWIVSMIKTLNAPPPTRDSSSQKAPKSGTSSARGSSTPSPSLSKTPFPSVSNTSLPSDGAGATRDKEKLLVVAPSEQLEEMLMRLAQMGLGDRIVAATGCDLEIAADNKMYPRSSYDLLEIPTESTFFPSGSEDGDDQADGGEAPWLYQKDMRILDVRTPPEFFHPTIGRVKGSELIPLDQLPSVVHGLDAAFRYLLLCKCGFRSSIAASLLLRKGLRPIRLQGGHDQLRRLRPDLCVYGAP